MRSHIDRIPSEEAQSTARHGIAETDAAAENRTSGPRGTQARPHIQRADQSRQSIIHAIPRGVRATHEADTDRSAAAAERDPRHLSVS
jgi:hypothetical protein